MKYKVNLEITAYQMVEIEAESIEEAREKAREANIDKTQLDLSEILPAEIYNEDDDTLWTV